MTQAHKRRSNQERFSRSSWWCYFHVFDDKFGVRTYQLGAGKKHGDIYSYDYSKGIESAGKLTLTLVPHDKIDYLEVLHPNAVVEFWEDNGDGAPPSMVAALVDRVAEGLDTAGQGKVKHMIHVSCTDWTKIFQTLPIFEFASLRDIEITYNRTNLIREISARAGRLVVADKAIFSKDTLFTPPEAVAAFIDAYFPGRFGDGTEVNGNTIGIDFSIPRPQTYLNDRDIVRHGGEAKSDMTVRTVTHALNVVDMLNFVQRPSKFPYGRYFLERSFGTYGNLWKLLRASHNPLLNELFIDTRPLSEAKDMLGATDRLDSRITATHNPTSVGVAAVNDGQFVKRYNLRNSYKYFGLIHSEGKKDEWSPRLILRRRPYSAEDMLSIPRHHASTADLVAMNVGRSDHDVKNFFKVIGRFFEKTIDMRFAGRMELAVAHIESWLRYGRRDHSPTTEYVLYSNSDGTPIGTRAASVVGRKKISPSEMNAHITTVLNEQTKIIAQWFYRNEKFLNGFVTFPHLRSDIRVGNSFHLTHARTGKEYLFYIESIRRSGKADAGSSTTVGLVRGLELEEYSKGDSVVENAPSENTTYSGGLQFIRFGEHGTTAENINLGQPKK